MNLEERKPNASVNRVTWEDQYPATNYLEEDFVVCVEVWPQGAPVYRSQGFSAAISRAGITLASDAATYTEVGVHALTNPALAWTIRRNGVPSRREFTMWV